MYLNCVITILSEIEPSTRAYDSTGVRTVSLARMLQQQHQVYIHTPSGTYLYHGDDGADKFEHVGKRGRHRGHGEVVIVPLTRWAIGVAEQDYFEAACVVDFYCPRVFENLFVNANENISKLESRARDGFEIFLIKRALRVGTIFIVGNSRQRDWLFGLMTVEGLFSERRYLREEPTNSVVIIPIVNIQRYNRDKAAARRHIQTLSKCSLNEKFVIVWSGGWHEWLDIEIVIDAFEIISKKYEDIVLLLSAPSARGVSHSNRVESIVNGKLAQPMADGRVVLMRSWLPFGEHLSLLLAADMSIIISQNHIEDHMSYRTRALESLENGVPVIINSGNIVAEEKSPMCFPVDPRDLQALVQCISDAYLAKNVSSFSVNGDVALGSGRASFVRITDELEQAITLARTVQRHGKLRFLPLVGRAVDAWRRVLRAVGLIGRLVGGH